MRAARITQMSTPTKRRISIGITTTPLPMLRNMATWAVKGPSWLPSK